MANKIIDKIKYWSQLFLLPVYGLSFLTPRNKKLWLYGSTFGRRFADNPRYFYLYMAQQYKDDIRSVWISHNKEVVKRLKDNGYEAYYYHSPKAIWLALTAGVYIFDNYSKDINFWQSGGAIKVNLWHGVGNKRINQDNVHDKARHPKNLYERWCTFLRRISDEKPSHYILATSKAMQEYFSLAFKVPVEHVLTAGYPRNDMLFDTCNITDVRTKAEDELLAALDSIKTKSRIIAYLPTFRASETEFFNVMDLAAFDKYLSARNYTFLVKLHPKSKLKEAFAKIASRNIICAESDIDVYTFLGKADMLVTDYSSVYSDYMLLGRPVVAFDYDFERYSQDSRDCLIDQDEYMPELKAMDMQQLMDKIDEAFAEDPQYNARMKSRERMFSNADSDSCYRLYQQICEIL